MKPMTMKPGPRIEISHHKGSRPQRVSSMPAGKGMASIARNTRMSSSTCARAASPMPITAPTRAARIKAFIPDHGP